MELEVHNHANKVSEHYDHFCLLASERDSGAY